MFFFFNYRSVEYIMYYQITTWLHEEQDGHGQGKWEGKQKGKSDKSDSVLPNSLYTYSKMSLSLQEKAA
jgi:hypothetical protein